MGLDIGDAVAEPADDGGGESVVLGAAAHEVDVDVDRLDRDALARAERVENGVDRREFEQPGDRAAVQIARPQ